jgi:D-alanyl-D-alanine carboxypeptidase/D-alanyl-D-alanine-endopeptidase (penicillin-binding protein 4)
MRHARWGVAVRSLDSGQRLFELDAGKLMVPASNLKILTLAAAAHALGWDYRFKTALETTGAVANGVLRGDLIVRGSGDPTINTRNGRGAAVFAEWIGALRTAGITAVDGRILGDDQAFDEQGIGAGWAWDYLQYGYAAPVGALQYNESTAELTVLPGTQIGDPAVVRLSPGSGFTLVNRAVTGPAGLPETVDYRRRLDAPVLEVVGSVPLGPPDPSGPPARAVSREVAVVNPTVFFVQSFRGALADAGIRVTGDAVDLDDVAAELLDEDAVRRVIATSESPPLSEIAAVMMKVSQNLYAETLLKAAGAARGGLGTAEGGRAEVSALLHSWGIADPALVMVDGSGLSRYDYASADLIVDVLERMYREPRDRSPFLGALAVAGRDGTIAARMRRSRAEGNASAKTGSLSNVRALSGYVRSRDGEMIAFAILANDFAVPGATVTWIQDLAVEVLANFSRHEGR